MKLIISVTPSPVSTVQSSLGRRYASTECTFLVKTMRLLTCECFHSSAAPILNSPSMLIDLSEFRLAYVKTCMLHSCIRCPATVSCVYVCVTSGAGWRRRTWCTSSRFCLWLRGLSGCLEVSACMQSASGQWMCHCQTQMVWHLYCR